LLLLETSRIEETATAKMAVVHTGKMPVLQDKTAFMHDPRAPREIPE
jgi:hypothetical protein